MKKFANILTIVAALLIAAGAALVITALAAQQGEGNTLTFEKTVQAQIINMRVVETDVGVRKKRTSEKTSALGTNYNYYVELAITEDNTAYTVEQSITRQVYDGYDALEKNKDMQFNKYINTDGNAYFSLKDIAGAIEEYQNGGHATKALAVLMVIGMVSVFGGMLLLRLGLFLKKKCRNDIAVHYLSTSNSAYRLFAL